MEIKLNSREVAAHRPIALGYCEAYRLLREKAVKIGYTSGVYGWNCDVYELEGVIITTGYRPIGKRSSAVAKALDRLEKRLESGKKVYPHMIKKALAADMAKEWGI